MKKSFLIFLILVTPSISMGLSFDSLILDTGEKNKIVRTEDIDGDGKKDFLIQTIKFDNGKSYKKIMIFFADANCYFPKKLSIFLSVPEAACAFDTADLDGDGQLELILFYRTKVVYYSPSREGFGRPSTILQQGGDALFPDMNRLMYIDLARNWRGDSRVEIMLTDFKQLIIFEKQSDVFQRAEALSVPMNSEFLLISESGDRDIDGRRFFSSVKIPTLDLVDYDADGDHDLYISMDNVVKVFKQTDGRFEEQAEFHHKFKGYTSDEKKFYMAMLTLVMDIDKDGYGDLILHKTSGSFSDFLTQTRIFKGSKQGLSTKADITKESKGLTPLISFTDANNDGFLDLVAPSSHISIMSIVRTLMSKKVYPDYKLFLYKGSKFYSEKPDYSAKTTFFIDEFTFPTLTMHGFPAKFGNDFTGDKKPDLLANIDEEELGIFEANEKNIFDRKPITTITAPSTYLTHVTDINGDQKSDIYLWYIQPEEEGFVRIYLAKE